MKLTMLDALLHAERDRLVLWLPVWLGVGIGLYFGLHHEPTLWISAAFCALGLAAAILARRHFILRLVAIIFFTVMLGMTLAGLRTQMAKTPVIYGELFFREVSGHIDDIERKEKGMRLTLSDPKIERFPESRLPSKITVTLKNASPSVNIGDTITLKAMLFSPPTPTMPGAFDFTRAFYFEGVGAVGFSPSVPVKIEKGVPNRFEEKLNALRLALAERIAKPMLPDNGAVAQAMMVGEMSGVSQEVADAMRDAGIYHVLSISGLHMSLAAGLLYMTVRFLLSLYPPWALRLPAKKIAASVGLLGAFIYLLLAGYPVPAIRSFIMVACVMLAVLFDRRGISLYSLAWAAMLILIWQPEALLGASFQLSFAATLAILALYERFSPMLFNTNARLLQKLGLYFFGLMATSLVAALATTPLVIYHFNRFSILGIAANMLMMPLASFWIMPAAVLAFFAMPFGLEHIPLAWLNSGISLMIEGSRWVASMPHAQILLPSPTFWGLLLILFGGLWLCLWQQKWRLFGIPFMVIGMCTVILHKPYDMLISDDGTKVAVSLPESGTFVFIRGTAGSFDGESWLRAHGQKEAFTLSDIKGKPSAPACDKDRCVIQRNGKNIAVGLSKKRTERLCAAHFDIVVSDARLDDPECEKVPLVFDKRYLEQNGAVGIRFKDGGIEVDTANAHRGDRPWVSIPPAHSSLYQREKPDIKKP